MAEGKIVRKGGVAATKTPTISLVSKDSKSITFTITNNESATVDVFWEVGDNTPEANQLSLASETTSGNITASGLSDNTEYTIFTFSNAVGKAGSATASLTVTTDEISIFTLGVEFDNPTDSVTRLDDAVGLSVTLNPKNGNEFKATSDFDDLPQYQLKRCMVNDDLSINYYIDSDNPNLIGEVVNTGSYTTGGTANYTGAHGQVMVEIPKFWWKYDEPTANQHQWRISNEAQTGYEVHPAFITDGVTKDYIYMSAFEAGFDGTKITSVSGVPVKFGSAGTGTIDDFRTWAQNRGTGWQQQTYWATHAVQLLYLIEYADFDSQTTIGRGISDYGTSTDFRFDTGQTVSLGNASGAASGTDGEIGISYRGIENIWGNVHTFVDGLNMDNRFPSFANENFASNTFGGSYELFNDQVSGSSGFVTNVLFPHFLASGTSGSSTSYLHDYHFPSSSTVIAAFGGSWDGGDILNGSINGMFYFILEKSSSYENARYGGRLQIL